MNLTYDRGTMPLSDTTDYEIKSLSPLTGMSYFFSSC